ncbi:MAG: SLBB domain-containing protein, partial [bacterium]|nr:SLBB domain-containing protein [Candidatus Kapabacteria bacterium]
GGTPTPRGSGGAADLPPVERSIDPSLYILGPNDQLIVTIPALEEISSGGEFPVVVSADNIIALPRGVAIDTRGMSLSEFRKAASNAFERRGGSAQIASIVLVRPRSIYVTVAGDVRNPGRQVLTAADRVSTAIDVASEIEPGTTEADLRDIVRQEGVDDFERTGKRRGTITTLANMPRRNVTVRHNDGTTSRADLVRYIAFGRQSDNPTLREGDHVIVAPADYGGATVAVGGAFNANAEVAFERGDNALMLARIGAGVSASGNPGGAFIARRTETGQSQIPVNLNDTAALAAMLLEPGDRLIVPRVESRPAARTGFVSVEGAVGQPSAYAIVNGETKLSEVIASAGGFADDASINGSYIVRESDPADLEMRAQIQDRLATISTSSLTLEDTVRYKFDQKIQRDRVSADFVRLFMNGDRSADISLRNGDRIVVPLNPRSVYVSGRVVLPGAVDYREGADVNYYINRAGGLSSSADPSRTQIIKYGTAMPLDVEDTQIFAGDEVYVVGERDLPARTPLELTATWLGILGSLGGITFITLQIIDILSK